MWWLWLSVGLLVGTSLGVLVGGTLAAGKVDELEAELALLKRMRQAWRVRAEG